MSSAYAHWVQMTGERITQLRYTVDELDLRKAESDTDRCRSLVEQIAAHAALHKIDQTVYRPLFDQMRRDLDYIDETIRYRKVPLWRKALLPVVRRIAGIVLALLGIDPEWLKILDFRKLLPPGDG